MKKLDKIKKRVLENLPKKSGVYLFYDNKLKSNTKHLTPVYIGKAINIKDRVKNHFQQPSYRDNLFIEKVSKISFIETGSEIEALILEANLIKKYLPKFNVVWRDDKNYFYVAAAQNKNKIPYVYITHQPFKNSSFAKASADKQNSKFKIQYIGPFVEGQALKKTLKYLRKVFPFYTLKKHPKNHCTWCHLDLCPGPGLFENPPLPKALEDILEYKKNIKKLTLILQGKRKMVLYSLKREMHQASINNDFEKAARIRDSIGALQNIIMHAHIIEERNISDNWGKTQNILQSLLNINTDIERIECYDISNIQGKNATGSMVVFTNGEPDKSQYKKFRIRMKNEPNDVAMLQEVLKRRFNHPEWPYPKIILIDGGIAQLNAAIKVKNQSLKTNAIRVISIAKKFKELFVENKSKPILLKTLPQEIYNLIINLDNEAHRFAITYHKKLRKKAFFNSQT